MPAHLSDMWQANWSMRIKFVTSSRADAADDRRVVSEENTQHSKCTCVFVWWWHMQWNEIHAHSDQQTGRWIIIIILCWRGGGGGGGERPLLKFDACVCIVVVVVVTTHFMYMDGDAMRPVSGQIRQRHQNIYLYPYMIWLTQCELNAYLYNFYYILNYVS